VVSAAATTTLSPPTSAQLSLSGAPASLLFDYDATTTEVLTMSVCPEKFSTVIINIVNLSLVKQCRPNSPVYRILLWHRPVVAALHLFGNPPLTRRSFDPMSLDLQFSGCIFRFGAL